MKFQLMAGGHIGDDNLQYSVGNIVESKVDLCKRFNQQGSEKFRQVAEDTPVTGSTFVPPEGATLESADAIFDKMDINDLKKFAAENGIKLNNTSTKDVIVSQIKRAKLQPA